MQATRTSTTLAALATLAALGLAAQPQAARAQSLTLNDGDAVTVSSLGTGGTIGGTPVANATTSYDASTGYDPANYIHYAVRTSGVSTFTLGAGGALKGGTYGAGLEATGGTVTVSGGTLSGGNYGLLASTGSTVTVSGGAISSGNYGLLASTGSTVTVSGGAISGFDGLYSTGGTVTVSGGAISGTNAGLLATGTGTINLFSQGDTPFLINGVSMNNTTLAHYTSGTSTISGTLLDGETLSTHFYDNGTINLNVGTPPVLAPEPSQTAALALGALGLSALALRARRRHAA